MGESSALERNRSFNLAPGNPVAESTHLNGSSFSWGSMSPKYRSCSSLCLNNGQTSGGNNKSVISSKTKNIKIDARIAADVQSKGLASRIVKYHETGTMLNRSMSAHNLYTKPGQFPAVTLKKTNLPYRATKQELSMIRIPAPEKSSFYGNTISSLLRSSSVIGIQSKRTEDLSRENRPIIHPPPTENDMAPTRSVLDVLKEISRKRINSDGLESEEASKKYCSRAGNDIADTISNTTQGISPSFITSSLRCQRYKRQRDSITPHQGVQLSEVQTSPEQAKKRVCNYNNDITSSLSSSIKCQRTTSPPVKNQAVPTTAELYKTQNLSVQRYHDHNKNKNNSQVDMRYENLENNLKKVEGINPITPLPVTPCVQDQTSVDGVGSKRTVSDPFYNSDQNISNLIQSQPANKPRLTLFNKKCDDSDSVVVNELCESISENTGDLHNTDDCASIPFVKPKKTTSKSYLRNPVLERTQKSKLALMLSGLKGELYQNSDDDEVDSSNEKQKLQTSNNSNTNTNAIPVTSTLTPATTATTLTTVVTSSGKMETPNYSNPPNLPTISKTNSLEPSSVNAAPNKTSCSLVGLKLSQPNSSPQNNDTKSTETQSKPVVPTLEGFSFGTTNASSSSVVTTSSTNSTITDCKTTTAPTTGSNMLTFGQQAQLTSSLSLEDKVNNVPVNMKLLANMLQFPAASNALTVLPPNTKTSSSTSTFLTGSSKTFPNDSIVKAAANSNPAADQSNSPYNSATKLNSVFNFTVPSTILTTTTTQSVPIDFGTSISSETLNTKSLTTTTATTTALTFSTAVTSENLGGITSTPSFTVDTRTKSVTNQVKISSGNGVPSVSFNFNGNVNTTSLHRFGTTTYSTNSGFSFGSDTKAQNSSASDQKEMSNLAGHNALNLNTSTLFGLQNFNTKARGESASLFGNATVKSGTQTQAFEQNVNNTSNVLAKPTVFGCNSPNSNSSTTTPFSFGSKSNDTPTKNKNDVSTAPGGFSFSTAISNNAESGFGFGSKSTGQNTLNQIFSGGSATAPQNKSFSFGSSTNKSENSASIFGGAVKKQAESTTTGFSFGSSTSTQAPTFNFGIGKNSSGDSVINSNNLSADFVFNSSAASKPNEVSANKTFSFELPQSVKPKQIQSVPTTNAISSNIFALSGSTKITQPPPFKFNSGSSTNLQTNATTTNNIFAASSSNLATGPGNSTNLQSNVSTTSHMFSVSSPKLGTGPGNSTNLQPNAPMTNNIFAASAANITTGPGDRPIRRATRRLQK